MSRRPLKLSDILTGLAVIVSFISLIISLSQTFYIGRQTRLTADQTESDNIAKTDELIAHIQELQTSVSVLQKWESLIQKRYRACEPKETCQSFADFLNSVCSDNITSGPNPAVCRSGGLSTTLRSDVLVQIDTDHLGMTGGDGNSISDKLLGYEAAFFDSRGMATELLDGNSLSGDMSAALKTCSYLADVPDDILADPDKQKGWADQQQQKWEDMQLAGNVAPLLIGISQNSLTVRNYLKNIRDAHDPNKVSSGFLSGIGSAIDAIDRPMDDLRALYIARLGKGPVPTTLSLDLKTIDWSISFIQSTIVDEKQQCLRRRSAAAIDEFNIRRSIDVDARQTNAVNKPH